MRRALILGSKPSYPPPTFVGAGSITVTLNNTTQVNFSGVTPQAGDTAFIMAGHIGYTDNTSLAVMTPPSGFSLVASVSRNAVTSVTQYPGGFINIYARRLTSAGDLSSINMVMTGGFGAGAANGVKFQRGIVYRGLTSFGPGAGIAQPVTQFSRTQENGAYQFDYGQIVGEPQQSVFYFSAGFHTNVNATPMNIVTPSGIVERADSNDYVSNYGRATAAISDTLEPADSTIPATLHGMLGTIPLVWMGVEFTWSWGTS